MSVAEQQAAEVGTELDRAVLEDGDAWQMYGAAVRRGAPRDVCRSLFDRAMGTLRRVCDLMGDRQWPLRSAEWRRGSSGSH